MSTNYGIDYGMGRTNMDTDTGIRFGVIPANDITQSWYDSSDPDYGKPSCGECGNEAVDLNADNEMPFDLDDLKTIRQEGTFRQHDVLRIPAKHRDDCGGHKEWHDEGRDYACLSCARSFDSDDAYGEEALGFNLDDGEYKAHQGGDDCDVFILESPYYTFAQYCSPCAPGACYLRNPVDSNGPKAYCFGPDWFDSERPCPYPVYRVDNDECIYTPPADAADAE